MIYPIISLIVFLIVASFIWWNERRRQRSFIKYTIEQYKEEEDWKNKIKKWKDKNNND